MIPILAKIDGWEGAYCAEVAKELCGFNFDSGAVGGLPLDFEP